MAASVFGRYLGVTSNTDHISLIHPFHKHVSQYACSFMLLYQLQETSNYMPNSTRPFQRTCWGLQFLNQFWFSLASSLKADLPLYPSATSSRSAWVRVMTFSIRLVLRECRVAWREDNPAMCCCAFFRDLEYSAFPGSCLQEDFTTCIMERKPIF